MFDKLFSKKDKNDGFQKLYQDNFAYVFSFVFLRTAYDQQATEEIVQETFVAAWVSHEQFLNNSAYRTWLCGIAKNKLYQYYREKASMESRCFVEVEELAELSTDFELETVILQQETKELVVEALRQINPVYRYALIMKYVDGYSVKEIAEQLDRTAKAIDGVLQKAKKSFLKAYLELERGGKVHA